MAQIRSMLEIQNRTIGGYSPSSSPVSDHLQPAAISGSDCSFGTRSASASQGSQLDWSSSPSEYSNMFGMGSVSAAASPLFGASMPYSMSAAIEPTSGSSLGLCSGTNVFSSSLVASPRVDATPTLVPAPLQSVGNLGCVETEVFRADENDTQLDGKEVSIEDHLSSCIEGKFVKLPAAPSTTAVIVLVMPQHNIFIRDKMAECVKVCPLLSNYTKKFVDNFCTSGVCQNASVNTSYQLAASLSLSGSSNNLGRFESADCINNSLDKPPPLPPEMDSIITLSERLEKFTFLDEYDIAGSGLGGIQIEAAIISQSISMILPSMMVWQPSNLGMTTLEKFCMPTVWINVPLSFLWYFVIFFGCSSNQHYLVIFEQAGLRHNGTKRPPPLPPEIKLPVTDMVLGVPFSSAFKLQLLDNSAYQIVEFLSDKDDMLRTVIGSNKWAVKEVANCVKEDSSCSFILVHSLVDGLEVQFEAGIIGSDDVVKSITTQLKELEKKKLVSATKEELKKKFEGLRTVIKDNLGDKVEMMIVIGRVVGSPYCFVNDEYSWIVKMERIMKARARRDSNMAGYTASKKTMEIIFANHFMIELRKRVHADKGEKPKKKLVMLQFEAALLNTRSTFDEFNSFVELAVDFVQVPLIAWKDGYVIFSSPRPPEAHSLPNLCTFMLMDLIVGQLIDFWVRNTVCNSRLWTFYLMPRVRNRQHGILYLGEHIKESYQAKDVSFLPYIHMYYTADTFSMGSTVVRHDVPEAILQIVSIGHCYDLWPDLYKSKRTNNKVPPFDVEYCVASASL